MRTPSLVPDSGTTPAGDDAAVTTYDFTRPPRISRDRRVLLEAVFTRFALSLQALLSSRLRVTTDVGLQRLEQTPFSEFARDLPTPCAVFVFEVGDGRGGRGVMDLSLPVAFQVVDRLLGGSGDEAAPERPLTPLEQGVVRGVCDRVLAALREAWQGVATLSPQIAAFEANPELLHGVAGPGEPVLDVRLDVAFASFRGRVTLCVPLHTLEPLLAADAAVAGPGVARGGEGHPQRARIDAGLRHVNVAVVARLPALRMAAREVLALRVGEVLHTGLSADATVDVTINGRPRFIGALGRAGARLGVRIDRILSGPEGEPPLRDHEGRVL